MQNVLWGQELWSFSRTANGRASGRTQIMIIVQTQGSYNSTILKLPLEGGIYYLASISGQRGWYERKFHLCNPPLSTPWPCEDIWSCWGLYLVYPSALFDSPTACVSRLRMKEIFAKTTLAASVTNTLFWCYRLFKEYMLAMVHRTTPWSNPSSDTFDVDDGGCFRCCCSPSLGSSLIIFSPFFYFFISWSKMSILI